ncbi:MAG: hypothetical protein CO064_12300 [Anaerolineae bacterium CG_4_9_14_0_8_um_filter_58_9]|nr:MAG: hypothetical protein CO064_12300 [Anaerolineae bacterium CG_4_9_14_0_8_um_filter_58_9]
MPTVQVEVITTLPEGWGICLTCEALIAQAKMDKAPHERGLDEYPPEWQADFRRFSKMIFDLSQRYGDSVMIRIWDPRSLQGLVKAIRYGVHRYPTFVVGGGKKVVGLDMPQLEQTLQAAGAVVQSTHIVAPLP